MIKKRNIIIAGGFLMVVFLIPILSLAKMVKNKIPISQYTGALIGRYQMIRLNTGITKALTGGTYMESNEVLLGKDNWLFYKVTTDGEPLYDYMGINHFDDNELSTIVSNMESMGEELENRGIRFAVVTVPNKEQVYCEYMPDTVPKIHNSSRLTELSAYIADNCSNTILGKYPYIDVTDSLVSAKGEWPVFYKTDTHWTEVGSFVALQKILQVLNGAHDNLETVVFNAEPGFTGDLCRISGTEEQFSDITYSLDGDSVDLSTVRDETLLIIGDSFGDSMIHTAKYYFKKVFWVRTKDYNSSLLEEYNPDIVIWECVERYLLDMKNYSISSM